MSSFHPIKSYGIILFTIVKGEPMYLLYQRRDTFNYMDFLRGIWSREDHVRSLLGLMTPRERQRLLDHNFDDLWNDLWTTPECKIYRDGYAKSRKKFESIQPLLPKLVSETRSTVSSQQWGFPKGKKNSEFESEEDTALREFREETRFENEQIDMVDYWFTELYKGTNGRYYSTKYFLAKTPTPCIVKYMDLIHSPIRKMAVSEEAEQVRWFTFREAYELVSDSPQRQGILIKVDDLVRTNCGI